MKPMTIEQAKETLRKATIAPLSENEATAVALFLDMLVVQVNVRHDLVLAAAQLKQAREGSDSCGLWRSIGRIASLVEVAQ